MDAYIVKHKNENIRMKSRSGGMFTALSDIILKEGGVVYGCAMDTENHAVHKRAVTAKERDEFRGSKYVQSDMRGIMKLIEKDLIDNKTVLFSGCICQVAGVESFCKKIKNGRLYTVSILCQGVPSPLILQEYLHSKEQKYGAKVNMTDFRNKAKYGWNANYETIVYGNQLVDSTEYSSMFYSRVATRESCFRCPYRNLKQPGDIVICDAWGINKADADFNDNKGVSLVLLQNSQCGELFNKALNDCDYRVADMKNYMQEPFKKRKKRPETRDAFWTDLYKYSYDYAFKKYVKTPLYIRIQRKLKKLLNIKQSKK